MKKRTLTMVEFEAAGDILLEFDDDGWRIQKPRNLGVKALAAARALVEKAEAIKYAPLPPPNHDRELTLEEKSVIAAKVLKLRLTRRSFRNGG